MATESKGFSFETVVSVLVGHTVRLYYSSSKPIAHSIRELMQEEGVSRAEQMIAQGYIEGNLNICVEYQGRELEFNGWWSILRDTVEQPKMRVRYQYTGVVFGTTWCGNTVGYAADTLLASTVSAGRDILDKAYNSGGLDSGFGFQNLTGALITETCFTTVSVEGKDYVREDYETIIIGDIPDWYNEVDFD